jgi:hypothetical protein
MVRPPPPPKILLTSGDHVRVGEWVEVDHCYSVGICSDGGIAVVVAFDDNGYDVRFVLPNPTYFLESYNIYNTLCVPR